MQRLTPRALLGLALGGATLAAMLMMFMVTMGGGGVPKAGAIFTPVNTAVGTPKPTPNVADLLSGVYDVDVLGIYKCISRTDHNTVDNTVKGAAYCYAMFNTDVAGTAPEPPCDAWHGPGPQGANPSTAIVPGEGNCAGHLVPPPYTIFSPTKVSGRYCPPGPDCAPIPGTTLAVPGDTLWVVGCFRDLGSALGPNDISVRTFTGVTGQAGYLASPQVLNGQTHLFSQSSTAQCDAADAGTSPGELVGGFAGGLSLTFTKAGLTTAASMTRDFDGDGCTDSDELWTIKAGSTAKCGNDPYNPFDVGPTSTDVSGSYDIVAVAIPQANVGGFGYYYDCKADIQQGVPTANDLKAKVSCYIDFPGTTVNNRAAGTIAVPVNSCGPAPVKRCGDGVRGAPPPGCNDTLNPCAVIAAQGAGCPSLPCNVSQYNFVSNGGTKHAVLTGVLNTTTNNIELHGCFKDSTPEGLGGGPLGSVVVQAKINAHTGVGVVGIYANQGDTGVWPANVCNGPDNTYGTADDGQGVSGAGGTPLSIVRQAPGAKGAVNRDTDGDGCPDKKELADTQAAGGMRDPRNRWDFFNPEKVQTPHTQTVADILKTVSQFGKNQGNALYTIDTDRTGITGGNPWNLGPPDGQQTVADILAAIKQFSQSCTL